MTRMTNVLKAHGVTKKSMVAYGDPWAGAASAAFYNSIGFKFYPREDGSDFSNGGESSVLTALIAAGEYLITYAYGWGYFTQWYDLGHGLMATLYPNEQEFYLTTGGGSLFAAPGSGGVPGVVIDARGLLVSFKLLTQQVINLLGMSKIIAGPAGWIESDHGVNYMGAQGSDGGHNMNTYVRYVNNLYNLPTNYYLTDVTAGIHNEDGTSCALWPLRGQQDTYATATCKPVQTPVVPVSCRVYSFNQWTLPGQTATSVAATLVRAAPTYVFGLVRFEAGAETMTAQMIADYTQIRTAVQGVNPACVTDVTMRPNNYATLADLQAGITAVLALGISYEIIGFNNYDSIAANYQSTIVSMCHAAGKLVAGDVNPSVFGAVTTKPDIITTSDWSSTPNAAMGAQMAKVLGVGCPVFLHINDGPQPVDGSGQTEHFNWNFVYTASQQTSFLKTLGKDQLPFHFALMWPFGWPGGSVTPPTEWWPAPTLMEGKGHAFATAIYTPAAPVPGGQGTGTSTVDVAVGGTMIDTLLTLMGTYQYATGMATDVSGYHHKSQGQGTSFALYGATANANLEFTAIYQTLAAAGIVFARTAIPQNVMALLPAYQSIVLETSVQGYNNAFVIAFNTGFDNTCGSYFNWNQNLDDSSIPPAKLTVAALAGTGTAASPLTVNTSFFFDVGLRVFVGGESHFIASIPSSTTIALTSPLTSNHPINELISSNTVASATYGTVLDFWLGYAAFNSVQDLLESDSTYANSILVNAPNTAFIHFSNLWNQIPLGGWYGVEQNTINALVIDHYVVNQQTWSGLGLVCHPWGTDSYTSLAAYLAFTQSIYSMGLSNFNVVLGLPSSANDPNYTADLAAVTTYVQNGGTLIVQQTSATAPTWFGTTATAIPYGHPITQPYAQADMIAAFGGTGSPGWINLFGSGKVITLKAYGFGDGFSLNGTANGSGGSDALASGLGYLTLNATLWASGQPTGAVYIPQYVKRCSWAAPLNSNGQGGFSGVGIHAIGSPLSTVLLSNYNAAPVPITVSLSPTFFGLTGVVNYQDANTGLQVTGSTFSVTMPAYDWMVFQQTTPPVQTNGWPSTPAWPLMFGPNVTTSDDVFSGHNPTPLYGTGTMQMTFFLASQEAAIQVAIYAAAVGSPTNPIAVTMYAGTTATGTVLATASMPPASVPTTANWTSFVTLTPTNPFAPGYYTLTFTSAANTSTSYYQQYMNFGSDWLDAIAAAHYVTPPAPIGGQTGVPILWVDDAGGNQLVVYPFGKVVSGAPPMDFIPASNYPILGIAPWNSDWPILFGTYSSGYTLTDKTLGQVVGTAPIVQTYNAHGLQALEPCQFPAPITLIAGHTYEINTFNSGATGSAPIGGLLRTVTVNPASAGPGFPTYWLGGVFYADFTRCRVLDYNGSFWTAPQGIGGTEQTAVRFTPTLNGTLTSVTVKLKSAAQIVTSLLNTYPLNPVSGIPVYAALYSDNPSSQFAPVPGSQLAIEAVDSGTFGKDGVLTIGGFNFNLVAGTAYWIVWSSPTATGDAHAPPNGINAQWVLQRNVSPYRFYSQFSSDSGSTWGGALPHYQGPTEITWWANTNSQIIGNPFDDGNAPETGGGWPLTTTSLIGQPFQLSSAGTATIIYVYGLKNKGILSATIYPDNAGLPNMNVPLASGSWNTLYQYAHDSAALSLTTSVSLQAATKYWIVYSCSTSGGTSLTINYYWQRPTDPSVPVGYEAQVSSNGGTSWSLAYPNEVGTTLFMVGVQPVGAATPAGACSGKASAAVSASNPPTLTSGAGHGQASAAVSIPPPPPQLGGNGHGTASASVIATNPPPTPASGTGGGQSSASVTATNPPPTPITSTTTLTVIG